MATIEAESMPVTSDIRTLQVGKFYPPYMGGMETHLQALCENLQPFVKVRVVVANRGRKSREDSINGVNVTRVGTLFK
ncbi:MAG: hypothetical protein ABI882_17665, partial [Acidobacteriota bacterium]